MKCFFSRESVIKIREVERYSLFQVLIHSLSIIISVIRMKFEHRCEFLFLFFMMTVYDSHLSKIIPVLVLRNIASILHWIGLKHHPTQIDCCSINGKWKYSFMMMMIVWWPRFELTRTWLFTSSLAWPAIRSLNIFSLETLANFVLQNKWFEIYKSELKEKLVS